MAYWQVVADNCGNSDIAGVPLEAFQDGYRLFADDGFWSATKENGRGKEVASGEGSTWCAETWIREHVRTLVG